MSVNDLLKVMAGILVFHVVLIVTIAGIGGQ